ncbi:hypothetical protein SODALDRAFT_355897 [Sodiomyces alkalinus F11]|uniref:Uncharacterized protein n=1 Tax=Sodiomyces alkalinus (strain CBS 110278 / VKM F-3762 / F11) TaxID=1314773 RepID=A0A3N2QA83_SODAK|nr:hypothetical protein SODALDRAFT_355897 [Sodiomyces alkalinus F11]ROT43673.1 hypothetical protein SODALDRAFT_355897 [Sodiomyces alkalinus F11]
MFGGKAQAGGYIATRLQTVQNIALILDTSLWPALCRSHTHQVQSVAGHAKPGIFSVYRRDRHGSRHQGTPGTREMSAGNGPMAGGEKALITKYLVLSQVSISVLPRRPHFHHRLRDRDTQDLRHNPVFYFKPDQTCIAVLLAFHLMFLIWFNPTQTAQNPCPGSGRISGPEAKAQRMHSAHVWVHHVELGVVPDPRLLDLGAWAPWLRHMAWLPHRNSSS